MKKMIRILTICLKKLNNRLQGNDGYDIHKHHYDTTPDEHESMYNGEISASSRKI